MNYTVGFDRLIRSFVKKYIYMLLMLLVCSGLFGCGKRDVELDNYYAQMENFSQNVRTVEEGIEAIDYTESGAHQELLGYLDQLDALYSDMAAFSVPSEFGVIESLADEASSNMTQSVSLYHMAFDGDEEYDPMVTDAALEYYQRAQKRIDYIGTIIQGEMPEGEDITIENASDDGSEFDDNSSDEESDDAQED